MFGVHLESLSFFSPGHSRQLSLKPLYSDNPTYYLEFNHGQSPAPSGSSPIVSTIVSAIVSINAFFVLTFILPSTIPQAKGGCQDMPVAKPVH